MAIAPASTSPLPSPDAYRVQVAPLAASQLESLSPLISAVLNARLERLARRERQKEDQGKVRGHLVARTFRALYEVDHAEGRVIVLEIDPQR
jgi:mRNA-degrading endonuclease RelE of RelBE toxin-antitoxin system